MGRYSARSVIKNFVVSFFASMVYVNYSVRSLNFLFLKRREICYKVVDLG